MKQNKLLNMDVLKIVYQNRFRFLKVFFITLFASALISLIVPEWYRSYSTILPPSDDGGLSNFASMLSDLPLQALGLGTGVSEEAILFTATFNSRTVMETVVNKFDLIKRYDVKNLEEAVKTLREHAGIVINEEGTLTIFAEARASWFCFFKNASRDEARNTAREMANFFVDEMDRVNKRLKTESAGNTRSFIEERYQENLHDLQVAEDEFKAFQKKYGMIALPEQTEATIKAAGEIKAAVVAKEIEMGVAEKSLSKTHPEYKRIKRELNELKKRYKEFNAPIDYENDGDKIDLFVPLEDAPEIGLKYLRKYREVFIQEKILEFLLPQFEQAKIKESKDTPTVQVLDEAVTPIKKHRPKRSLFVLFFTFSICIISFFYIVYKPSVKAFLDEVKS